MISILKPSSISDNARIVEKIDNNFQYMKNSGTGAHHLPPLGVVNGTARPIMGEPAANRQPSIVNSTQPQRSNLSKRANIRVPQPLSLVVPSLGVHIRDQDQHVDNSTRTNQQKHVQFQQQQQQYNNMTTEDLLYLMREISDSTSRGQFSGDLGNKISSLAQQLKNSGHSLERNHKKELDEVFKSLRRACTQDTDQLDPHARMTIVDLLELRAMAWKQKSGSTNAGSQHMQHKNKYTDNNEKQQQKMMLPVQSMTMMDQQNYMQPPLGNPPISAPPYGIVPLSPFHAFGHQKPMGFDFHQSMQPAPAQQPVSQAPPTSYYLIPANSTVTQYYQPQTMIQQPPSPIAPGSFHLFSPNTQPAHAQSLAIHPSAVISQPTQVVSHQPLGGQQMLSTPPKTAMMDPVKDEARIVSEWPKGVVMKHNNFSRPQQVPGKNQYKEDVIIRNSDSGKIMGVKGRRVALVEEISRSIISFQKVLPGAKERILTITGNTEEIVQNAKILIEDTIRRNVSPLRPLENSEEEGSEEGEGMPRSIHNSRELLDEKPKGIRLDTAENGVLKLTSDDPQLLQAAQEALTDYMSRLGSSRPRTHTTSVLDRELRKERRKSMPYELDDNGSSPPQPINTRAEALLSDRDPRRPRFNTAHNKIAHGEHVTKMRRGSPSTRPANDQAEKTIVNDSAPPAVQTRPLLNLRPKQPQPQRCIVDYSRELLVACALSPLSTLSPTIKEHIEREAPECLRQNFDTSSNEQSSSTSIEQTINEEVN